MSVRERAGRRIGWAGIGKGGIRRVGTRKRENGIRSEQGIRKKCPKNPFF